MGTRHLELWPSVPRTLTLPQTSLWFNAEVSATVIIGRKDPRRGEVVKAVVVLKPASRGEVDEAQLSRWAKDNMAAYKVPASFELAESLPKSATGKIQWRVLQEQQDERDRAGG